MGITRVSTSSLTSRKKYNNFLANTTRVTGAFDSIATVVVGVGGQASATFSSIPQIYTHLQIRGILATSAGGYIAMTFNSDVTNSYTGHEFSGNGTTVSASNFITRANVPILSAGTSITQFAPFVIDILDYANTYKSKTTRTIAGFDANGTGSIMFDSGLWTSTLPITNINIAATSSGVLNQYSHFALYGIKG